MRWRVSRRRCYWVREEVDVESATSWGAHDKFLRDFKPSLSIEAPLACCEEHCKGGIGKIEVIEDKRGIWANSSRKNEESEEERDKETKPF